MRRLAWDELPPFFKRLHEPREEYEKLPTLLTPNPRTCGQCGGLSRECPGHRKFVQNMYKRYNGDLS